MLSALLLDEIIDVAEKIGPPAIRVIQTIFAHADTPEQQKVKAGAALDRDRLSRQANEDRVERAKRELAGESDGVPPGEQ